MRLPAFTIQRVTLRYKRAIALDRISLTQDTGTVLGLVGLPNAGKTALIHLLAGLDKPSSGRISLLGGSPIQSSIRKRIGIGFSPDCLDEDISIINLLVRWSRMAGFSAKVAGSNTFKLLKELRLGTFATQSIAELSESSRKLLSLGPALIGEPDLLLLDNAFDTLDAADRALLSAALFHRVSAGATVVFANQPIAGLKEVCSHIALMHRGTLLGKATPEEICSSLRGLLFKYEIDGDHTQSADWGNAKTQFTGNCTHVVSDHDISEQLALCCGASPMVEINPTLEEACNWILRHPEAVSTRSKLWGRQGETLPSTG